MKKMHTRTLRAGMAVAAALAVFVTAGCTARSSQPAQSAAGGNSGELLMAADYGSPSFARNFNPFSGNARLGAHYMYEPLEVVNTIDGKATPFLATSDKIVNPTTIQYTIRDGVKWSDGTPFTAKDVVFTFDLVKRHPALDTLGVWQYIDSISQSGNTLTFHLKSPNVPAASIIDQQIIVPEHIWKSVKNPVTWTDPNPVVTGPYTLSSFAPNQYTLKKNPNYWQADKVAAKTIVMPALTPQNIDLKITKDPAYSWAYTFITDVDKTWVGSDKEYRSYWFPPGGTVALFPNLTKAPFDNLDFRQGLSYSLDRNAVAENAEEGYVKAAGQTGLLLPNQDSWLNPAIADQGQITQNRSKALQYFAKAGYTMKGGQLVDASGKQLNLTVMIPNGYSDWLRGLQTVQTQLKAMGINVTFNQPQPPAYTQALDNGDFDIAMGSFGGSGSVYQDLNSLLNSQFATPVGTSTSANFQRFKDPQADQLLTQFQSATSPTQQKEIAGKLQSIVYDNLPVISLFYGGLWGLTSNRSFTNWPSAQNPYAPPSTWTETSLLILTNLKAR